MKRPSWRPAFLLGCLLGASVAPAWGQWAVSPWSTDPRRTPCGHDDSECLEAEELFVRDYCRQPPPGLPEAPEISSVFLNTDGYAFQLRDRSGRTDWEYFHVDVSLEGSLLSRAEGRQPVIRPQAGASPHPSSLSRDEDVFSLRAWSVYQERGPLFGPAAMASRMTLGLCRFGARPICWNPCQFHS